MPSRRPQILSALPKRVGDFHVRQLCIGDNTAMGLGPDVVTVGDVVPGNLGILPIIEVARGPALRAAQTPMGQPDPLHSHSHVWHRHAAQFSSYGVCLFHRIYVLTPPLWASPCGRAGVPGAAHTGAAGLWHSSIYSILNHPTQENGH